MSELLIKSPSQVLAARDAKHKERVVRIIQSIATIVEASWEKSHACRVDISLRTITGENVAAWPEGYVKSLLLDVCARLRDAGWHACVKIIRAGIYTEEVRIADAVTWHIIASDDKYLICENNGYALVST